MIQWAMFVNSELLVLSCFQLKWGTEHFIILLIISAGSCQVLTLTWKQNRNKGNCSSHYKLDLSYLSLKAGPDIGLAVSPLPIFYLRVALYCTYHITWCFILLTRHARDWNLLYARHVLPLRYMVPIPLPLSWLFLVLKSDYNSYPICEDSVFLSHILICAVKSR